VIERIMNIMNEKLWFKDPVRTLFFGYPFVHENDQENDTFDSSNQINGRCVLSTGTVLKIIESHCKNYQVSTPVDQIKEKIRNIELDIFQNHLVDLISNIILDELIGETGEILEEIRVTTIIASIEKLMNDDLLSEERSGIITIVRNMAVVSHIFEHHAYSFLFKIFRLLEAGIPVIILARGHVQIQYIFRWCQLVLKKMSEQKIDLGMLTFLSFSEADEVLFLRSCSSYLSLLLDSSYNLTKKPLISSQYIASNCKIIGSGGLLISVVLTENVEDVKILASLNRAMNTRVLVIPPSIN